MATTDVKEAIKDRFIWDNRILSADINVEIKDGTVRLTGEVPNYSGKLAAEEDAMAIEGVRNVENHITVRYPESIVRPTDEQIRTFIEDLIVLDDRINSSEIDVKVDMGRVTLSGIVDAFWKKEVIEGYIIMIAGVTEVKNLVYVKPSHTPKDDEIELAIINACKRNSLIENVEDISVSVSDGVVTLSGSLPSSTEKKLANDLASYTKGVVDVINNISIWAREK